MGFSLIEGGGNGEHHGDCFEEILDIFDMHGNLFLNYTI